MRRGASVTGHMAEGLRFIVHQQTMLVLISLVAVSAFLSMPYSTLMPVFAGKVLQKRPAGCGVPVRGRPSADALPGAGGAAAGPPADDRRHGRRGGRVGRRVAARPRSPRPLADRRQPGVSALLLAFSTSRSFGVSLALLFGVGISFVMQNALANTLLQIITPDDLRGRVMSIYTLTSRR